LSSLFKECETRYLLLSEERLLGVFGNEVLVIYWNSDETVGGNGKIV